MNKIIEETRIICNPDEGKLFAFNIDDLFSYYTMEGIIIPNNENANNIINSLVEITFEENEQYLAQREELLNQEINS